MHRKPQLADLRDGHVLLFALRYSPDDKRSVYGASIFNVVIIDRTYAAAIL